MRIWLLGCFRSQDVQNLTHAHTAHEVPGKPVLQGWTSCDGAFVGSHFRIRFSAISLQKWPSCPNRPTPYPPVKPIQKIDPVWGIFERLPNSPEH
jgi:hypothetical protein